MAATIRQELEEEFLSTIRKGQETALEAAKPLAEAVHYVIPTMAAVRVPLAGLLPTAREAVAGGYEFAGHLLANQRQRRNPQFPALPRSVVRDEGDGP
jgi:hypothetical protein